MGKSLSGLDGVGGGSGSDSSDMPLFPQQHLYLHSMSLLDFFWEND
jgi:hypothetical protein